MEYLKKPNLPEKKVSMVIIANDTPLSIVHELNRLQIEPVFAPKNPMINDATAAHPDLSILHLGENNFMCASFAAESYSNCLEDAEIIQYSKEIKSPYPTDIALNVAIVENRLFLSKKSFFERIFEQEKMEFIHVNQGYTKCNIAIIDDNAIITEDASIYQAAVNAGMDALKLNPGNVLLNGYPHGFIGGACGKLDRDVLALSGRLNNLTEHDAFRAFCRNRGVYIVELSNEPPCDLGSILPITY